MSEQEPDSRRCAWLALPAPDGQEAQVTVRLDRDEHGRWTVAALYVEGQVTGELLRAIPVARIEAAANLPTANLPAGPPPGGEVTLGQVRSWATAIDPARLDRPREPLQRPDGSDPEGFYRRVADAYRMAATSSHRPAALLAEEAGVPVATVHRWVAEARRRQLLPPGRKGKAG